MHVDGCLKIETYICVTCSRLIALYYPIEVTPIVNSPKLLFIDTRMLRTG